jgi:cytochrome d ubiquinol oxidase subunit II
MPPLDFIIGGVLVVALTIYALTGGADFGAGVWDLLATGPRASDQRALIANAIGPIWEANNVWLVLVIVVLFTAFPPAFAAILTALFVPLSVMLVGIVLRGAAFAFRSHVPRRSPTERLFTRAFAIGSIITPIMLGVALGTLASGRIPMQNGVVTGGFFDAWLFPFAWAVGALALALFAYLAALYLAVEAASPELRGDFRLRALAAALVADGLATLVLVLARNSNPPIAADPMGKPWALPLVVVTGLCAVGALWALWVHGYYLARALGVIQVTLILWGWAAAQYPFLVPPTLTISNAAAPAATLRLLLIALIAGALVLFPSFYYLYRVFKGPGAFAVVEMDAEQTDNRK